MFQAQKQKQKDAGSQHPTFNAAVADINTTDNNTMGLNPLLSITVRITENPYTPQRERLCMLWGNPVIFTDFGEIL